MSAYSNAERKHGNGTPIRVLTVVGARPQFIKAGVVSRAFRGRPMEVEEFLIHTGQHYDANMSDVFFAELNIPQPMVNLGIGGGSHAQNTGRMLELLGQVLEEKMPDWVLLYGDTDSTLAGALAAAKLHIKVAHVEAGLRSFNRRMPEEINRVLTDHLSSVLFVPTPQAIANLDDEGIRGPHVINVGDVMLDAAIYYGSKASESSDILKRLGMAPKSFVLATIHRSENTDSPERLDAILSGLAASSLPVVLPLHPRTSARLKSFGRLLPSNIISIPPLSYLDMIQLEQNAAIIATDSGGVQKEAFFHSVPCLTLREETEWIELVEIGVNKLVGANPTKIADSLLECQTTPIQCGAISSGLYGTGDAAERIVDTIAKWPRA